MNASLSNLLVLVIAGHAALAVSARAQQPSDAQRVTARELGREGLRALDAGDMATADERLTRAIELYDAPTLRMARANARMRLGHMIAAGEDCRVVMRWPKVAGEPGIYNSTRQQAREMLVRIEEEIPHLTLIVRGKPASITVGREAWPKPMLGVPRPLDPGDHAIRVTTAAGAVVERTVSLRPGGSETVTIDTPPESELVSPLASVESSEPPADPRATADRTPSPDDASQGPPTGAYVLGGVAVALAVGAVVTGVMALDRRADFEAQNHAGVPQATREDLHSDAVAMGWIATACAGAALVTGGISAYLFLAPSDEGAGPSAALGITGRF
jgi:hypothetical protein